MRKTQIEYAHRLVLLERAIQPLKGVRDEEAHHALMWGDVQSTRMGCYPEVIPLEFQKPMMELLRTLVRAELAKLGIEND